MKALKLLLIVLLCTAGYVASAQTVTGIKANKDGKMGEFTEWTPMEVKGADGSTATIEYRIALTSRTGIACNYLIEVKNPSADKIDVVVVGTYYDKLVKGSYREEKKSSLKPGKSISVRVIAQGCKKDKGVEADDYGHCMNCEFEATIIATK